MPTWPPFASTPMRSTGRRPPSRSDDRPMRALRHWHVHSRDSQPADRITRMVQAALDTLPERERQAVELWLADVGDRRIEELTGLPPPTLGLVRMTLLDGLRERLQAGP